MAQSSALQPRQNPPFEESDGIIYDDDFWYNSTAYVVKWSIISAIFFLCILFVVVGYSHARSRMKKGLRPLAYHKWLVPRKQRMQFAANYQNNYMAYPVNREQDGYAMNGYAPPPPVYDNSNENAPAYLPPDGASKVNPDQGDYAAVPPPGAPPTRNDDLPAYPAPVAGSSGRQQL